MKTLSYILLYALILLIMSLQTAVAQDHSQTVKGRVVDRITQMPLPGASVVIVGTNPLQGATTNEEGYFKIEGVETGRINLEISFLGYQRLSLPNIVLTTGKELIINAELEEQVIMTEEVVISASDKKMAAINEMALVSARSFTIEESQRYAGARNDVARMASNFAGVGTSNDAENSIVIRGNSPFGLLWRLEGVDIPNPNHYGGMGATGGPVGMLNNNVLANSDFLTAAFPAEYTSALSGVFDLKMRNGNYEKHEFLGQVGFNGFEVGLEGPISRKNYSSYLVNARYSTLEVMSEMGVNVGTGTAVPRYKDLSFKVNLPSKHLGRFSLFGLGGVSSIDFIRSENPDEEDNLYGTGNFDLKNDNYMGVVGLSNIYTWNKNTYTKIILAATTQSNNGIIDTFSQNAPEPAPYIRNHLHADELTGTLLLGKRFNSRLNLKAGFTYKLIGYDLTDSMWSGKKQRFYNVIATNGTTSTTQAYAQLQYKFTDRLVANAGLAWQGLELNGQDAWGPRLGLKWEINEHQSVNAGYGLHSRMLPLYIYYTQTGMPDNDYTLTNKNLDFMSSRHWVLGYDVALTPHLRAKAETYYQHTFDVPVDSRSSYFSIINSNSFNGSLDRDSLVNNGTGTNYGLELTIERFLHNNFYLLVTTSLYRSLYKGSNGIEKPTMFDGGYVVNFLAGKDIKLNPGKKAGKSRWLAFDIKMSYAGGQRYTPLDLAQSARDQRTVWDENKSFSKQFDPYFRTDLRIGYRVDGAKVSQEFVFDIQNITNHKNPLYLEYNLITGKEEIINQLGFFPMMQYRIVF